jgi:hypothetical protein
MKVLRYVTVSSALALGAWGLGGCAHHESTDSTQSIQTYQCPSCKETIEWQYYPGKPWIKTGKKVVHSCPGCTKEWGANLTTESTCQECGKEHLECPVCKKHG